METSNTFLLEPGHDNMFDDYAALYNAIDSLDNPDHVEITGDYFRSSFSHPSVEVGRDIALIQNHEGTLVAAGTIFTQQTSPAASRITVQVHPDFRNRGVGSMVLEHLFETGRKRGSTVFKCRIPSFRTDAISFAEFHGFEYDFSWIKMRLDYDQPLTQGIQSQELNFRLLNPKRELKRWGELHNGIYEGSYDSSLATVESMKAQVRHVNFDPRLLVVCELNGKPIGIGSGWSASSDPGSNTKRTLQIQGIGILPKYKRRGYGQTLLVEILNRAFEIGYRAAELIVHNANQAAIGMYAKYKFCERYRHLWYKKVTYEQMRQSKVSDGKATN
ncbi:MAG: GNAT family N-acetyltransferase [Candidatus Thorarchaeota archaeon]|nr:GNAT family N-acetyltransferase [Candidatus Thorarchaeota archaeon]